MRRNVRRLNREIGVHTSAPIPSAQSNLLLTYQPQKPNEKRMAIPASPRNPTTQQQRISFDIGVKGPLSMMGSPAGVMAPGYGRLGGGQSFDNDDDSSVDSTSSSNIYASFSDLAAGLNANNNSTGNPLFSGEFDESVNEFGLGGGARQRKSSTGGNVNNSASKKKTVRKAVNLSGV